MNENEYNEVSARLNRLESVLNGGKGSGNFGHYGRPGEVGGSSKTQVFDNPWESGDDYWRPLWDAELRQGQTYSEYYRDEKDLATKVIEINPKDYLWLLKKGGHSEGEEHEYLQVHTDWEGNNVVDKYREKIRQGHPIATPVFTMEDDFRIRSQEGRHRSEAASLEGIEKLPVMISYHPSKVKSSEIDTFIGRVPFKDITAKYHRLVTDHFADEKMKNGGPGSGNFGHYGRPGEIGGSADTPTHLYDVQSDEERIADRDKRFGMIYQGIKQQRSINLDRENNPIEWGKSDGFLVRGYGKRASISVKDFDDDNDRFAFIQEFEASNLGHLIGDNDVLSGWVKDGQVVLDASKRFKTAKEAAKEAALRGQKAVVDIKRVKALDTKDLMKKYKIESEVITQLRKKEAEEKERKRKQGEIDIKVRYTQGMTMKAKTYNELMGRIQRLEKLLNQERPDPETIIETDQDEKYGIDVLTDRIVSDKAKIEAMKARIDKSVSLMADGQNVNPSKLEEKLKALEDDLREAQEELRIADSKKKEEQALVQNGGKGSGNFGHKGRPGEVGGSGDGIGIRVHEGSKEIDYYYAEDGERVLAGGTTPEEARARAIKKAKIARIEEKVGKKVKVTPDDLADNPYDSFSSRYMDFEDEDGNEYYYDEITEEVRTKGEDSHELLAPSVKKALADKGGIWSQPSWEIKGTQIKKKLKEYGINTDGLSVSQGRGGYSTAWHIKGSGHKTDLKSVERILKIKLEHIDRDERSGEILLGGNTYVFTRDTDKNSASSEMAARLARLDKIINGGKGSGNYGHYGRPGMVGGSAPADGAVQAIGKGITDRVRETGGFTVSTQGDFKELGSAKGFGVGGFGTERSITVDEWNNSNKRRAFIRKYLEENRATFEKDPERNHFGGWEEEGRVYLDVTRIFKSQKQAATEAAKTHQDAITDFSKTYESGKAFPRTKDLVKKYGLQDIWKKSANVRKEERKADQELQKKTEKKKKDPLDDIPF